jgi:SEC-C motif domain protein
MYCYCGSGKPYLLCCLPLLLGACKASSCEQLMRSRYSAYCHHNIDYIYRTYHPTVQVHNPTSALAAFAHDSHFIALDLLTTEQSEREGFVSFKVRYLQQNMLFEFAERSRFLQEDWHWYYIDGVLTEQPAVKINSNELCPCNSGKKFKHCTVHRLSGN